MGRIYLLNTEGDIPSCFGFGDRTGTEEEEEEKLTIIPHDFAIFPFPLSGRGTNSEEFFTCQPMAIFIKL